MLLYTDKFTEATITTNHTPHSCTHSHPFDKTRMLQHFVWHFWSIPSEIWQTSLSSCAAKQTHWSGQQQKVMPHPALERKWGLWDSYSTNILFTTRSALIADNTLPFFGAISKVFLWAVKKTPVFALCVKKYKGVTHWRNVKCTPCRSLSILIHGSHQLSPALEPRHLAKDYEEREVFKRKVQKRPLCLTKASVKTSS